MKHYVIIPITASFFQGAISAIDSAIISLLESATCMKNKISYQK